MHACSVLERVIIENMKKSKRVLKLLKFDCGQCSSCCRNIIVDVTGPDIERLAEYTGMPADKLVRLYSNEEIDDRKEDKEASDWIKLSYGKRTIGLNKKRNGDCIFLLNDKTCEAYDARPMTCRVFPVTRVIDDKDEVVDLEVSDVITDNTIKCKRIKGNGRSYESFMALARLASDEEETYSKKVKEWNRSIDKGVKNDFLNFLGFKTST